MRRLLALLAATALILGAGACGAVTPYAAKVNDAVIDQRQLDTELKAILGNRRYLQGLEQSQIQVQGRGRNSFDSAFVARILTRQIFLELVHQELERRKIELKRADLAQARRDVAATFEDGKVLSSFTKTYRDQLVRRTAEVTAVQAALAQVEVDDAAVRKYYEANKAQFAETCVEHILVESAPDASAVQARLAAGEDFGAIARAVSKDPGSGAQGGKLGCVASGQFVPEFEAAMATLSPGQTSAPVQTQFGFHLIRVTERKAKPLAEASEEIRQRLLGGGQEEFNRFLDSALKKAKIEINPRYGRFVKGQQPGVVPPEAPEPVTRTDGNRRPAPPAGADGAPADGPPPNGADE